MDDETDTFAAAETDNVTPSDDDTPESFDYYDPDDDEPDTVEDEADEGTDDEDGETEEQPDEDSDDTPEEEGQAEPTEASLDAKVRLPDGTETTVEELTKGYQRQADYTRKTQELTNQRKALEANASQIENVSQAFVDQLSSLLPDEPDMQLAYSDPAKYMQQKAIYDDAMKRVQGIIETGKQAKSVTDEMSAEDKQQVVQAEMQKLNQAVPETATAEGRQAFFESVAGAAQDFGFSREELQGITDHRLFVMAHWAQKGKAAEKAKASAKAKVEKAKPVPSRKPGQGANKGTGNREAMRKLERSGSIKDALAVDWD